MNRLLGGLATAALVTFAVPVGAVPYTYTYTFGGSSPTQATGGTTVTTSGNTVTQVGGTINASDTTSAPAGGPTLNTHISAYSKAGNGSNSGTVTKAYLGNYACGTTAGTCGGLGVTNLTEVQNTSPSHTLDNNSGTDFIVFQFDQKVNLSGALLDLFADSGSTDSDITIGYLNTTYSSTAGTGPFAAGANFNTLGITTLQMAGTGSPDPSPKDFSSLTSGLYFNTWIIMADMLRTGTDYDDFKISGISATVNAAVPEPATWAMMISGFGLIGSAMRRRTKVKVVLA